MNTSRQDAQIGNILLGFCVALISLTGCRPQLAPEPTLAAATPLPTLTLDEPTD